MFFNTIAKADSTHTYYTNYIHIQNDKYNEKSWLKKINNIISLAHSLSGTYPHADTPLGYNILNKA